ncbi:MAG: transaldolase family protein [Candidatus Bathyarchaeia archaeon]
METLDTYEVLSLAKPEGLQHPCRSLDYADHVVKTAMMGYPQLAADSLLNPDLIGRLADIVGSIVRQLNLVFMEPVWVEKKKEDIVVQRGRAYDVLLEIAINLFGLEKEWIGFTNRDFEVTLKIIRNTLSVWESVECEECGNAEVAKAVVRMKIEDMKKVMRGDPRGVKSMVAFMGENVEKKLEDHGITLSFLDALKEEIQSNVYYVMSKKGMCRFGNDYALGLRWLRRLGYVQVSTNPVLAAIAYRDDPNLWSKFEDYLRRNPEYLKNMDDRQDELTMLATMLALWPNMEVFRPVFYLKGFSDGMISYQLNPNVADDVKRSLEDALKIYKATQEYFMRYDEYLLWGWSRDVERGRPNIVFKVAGSSPAAVDITSILESLGIGTNNTITFTVSQEASLILAKMRGMAKAVKMGIKPTKVYETNMGGRLEGHLREVKAAEFLMEALKKFEDPEAKLIEFCKKLGVPVASKTEAWTGATGWGYNYTAKNLEEKVILASFSQYLKTLANEHLASLLVEAKLFNSRDDALNYLADWEKAIGLAGTLVAQRVWWIFFSSENKVKWINYLISEYGLAREEAENVLNDIDVLPASKRKPMDTFLTLARWNMTNTEFPDHQLNVLNESKSLNFEISNYDNAIMMKYDSKIIEILNQLSDFLKAYELTPDLSELLVKVGVEVKDMGNRGLPYDEWGFFGSTVKTMTGFTEAYNSFRSRVVEIAKKVAKTLNI